ncbi:hypothetical protein ACWEO4_24715 [Streptomyces sp. NPDC004393]|uniref:hypothetical protein n=1 Tax=Streptomyces sp. NPDC004533 TaxID=3154278 RepID=UPI0033B83169
MNPSPTGPRPTGGRRVVGSADEVATALANYRKLGITHFVLSDTPYQREIDRIGAHLLARLREPSA